MSKIKKQILNKLKEYANKMGRDHLGGDDYTSKKKGGLRDFDGYDNVDYNKDMPMDEASRGTIHKAAKKGSYPVTLVVVKDGKVINQVLNIKTPAEVPAAFNVVKNYHKHKGATVHIEDRTGKRLFSESVNEDSPESSHPQGSKKLTARTTVMDMLDVISHKEFGPDYHKLSTKQKKEVHKLAIKGKLIKQSPFKESVNERNTSVNKRRAGAELKQKLKGKRSDGMGKYTATIYGLDSKGKRVELKSLNDLNKYSKFELDESINEGKVDRVVGHSRYKYVGDGRKGKAIVSGPMKDREKEAIIKRAKKAGYVAKPNMGGGVTIHVESVNEGMFSMIDQIRQDSKDVRDFVKNVFKDKEFRKMKDDKEFIKYLKSIYEGVDESKGVPSNYMQGRTSDYHTALRGKNRDYSGGTNFKKKNHGQPDVEEDDEDQETNHLSNKQTHIKSDKLKVSEGFDKVEHLSLLNQALRAIPGSQKQKEIIRKLNKVRKAGGMRPLKEQSIVEYGQRLDLSFIEDEEAKLDGTYPSTDAIDRDIDETAKRDYKDEYKKFQSSKKSKKYRAELNKYNRQKGTYGNGDGKDASHKGGKIVGFESASKNRGRKEKSRLKKK
jgi:hypothetical protein